MGKHLSDERDSKSLIYVFGGTLVISIVIFLSVFNMYDKELKDDATEELYSMKMKNSIVSNDELKTVSYSNDKTVASSINSNQVNNVEKVQNKVSKMPVEAKVTKINNTVSNTTNTTNTVNTTVNNTSTNVVETKEELKFVAPVSGEISKDFAKDTLIYSNTLEEWTTHLGIDIKAAKTSVVVASADGIVEKITKELNKYLGDGFVLSYANNLDMDWEKIVPKAQEKTAYGVLKVDSGTTTQLADQTITVEQLTLKVAIPGKREIFDEDVANLRSMKQGLNNYVVFDDDVNALLLFGEYQDSQQQLVNGNYWWIASVVFSANFHYDPPQLSCGALFFRLLLR